MRCELKKKFSIPSQSRGARVYSATMPFYLIFFAIEDTQVHLKTVLALVHREGDV